MSIKSLKSFLMNTTFDGVDYRVYSPYWCERTYHSEHGGWHCYYFTITNPSKTLMVKFKDNLFDTSVVVYQNDIFIGHFKGLFLKWVMKRIIKKAFIKHIDEVLKNWKTTNK